MEKLFQIQGINKEDFISIIENVIDNKITANKDSGPENLSVQQISKLLSVTELTVYNYIHRGLLPATKIGRKYVINRKRFESALNSVKSLKYKRDA